jgi:hypothetical protein
MTVVFTTAANLLTDSHWTAAPRAAASVRPEKYGKKEEPMKNLHLKVVHSSGHTGSLRLCDSCVYGMVLRGEGMEFVYCGYMRDYVAVRVAECNRYAAVNAEPDTEPVDDAVMQLLAQYTID